jgi:hypothetical protein
MMPYKLKTYKNGFTEIIPYKLTAREEMEQMKRMVGVKSFPSVNSRSNSDKVAQDQEPPQLQQVKPRPSSKHP